MLTLINIPFTIKVIHSNTQYQVIIFTTSFSCQIKTCFEVGKACDDVCVCVCVCVCACVRAWRRVCLGEVGGYLGAHHQSYAVVNCTRLLLWCIHAYMRVCVCGAV